jgi:hypothetical protein
VLIGQASVWCGGAPRSAGWCSVRRVLVGACAGLLVLALGSATSTPAFAGLDPSKGSSGTPTGTKPTGPSIKGHVSSKPAAWTPSIATSGLDGTVETVRQIVQCGATMYAVGTFTSIVQNGVTYARNNAFSFSATTGAMTSWNPGPNGTVNSVALSSDCSTAYVGGLFSTISGHAVKNFAAVSATTGALLPGFATTAGGQVNTLLRVGVHLLVGGYFTGLNGSTKQYLLSVSLTTGRDDGYVNIPVSGTYSFTDAGGNPAAENATRIYTMRMNAQGTRVVMTGVFTSVNGQARQQAFVLALTKPTATLDPWYSTELNAFCLAVQPFYLQAAAWSPDGGTLYFAATGTKPATGPGYIASNPRSGLCDAASAFPARAGLVSHTWVNYTGCDSLYSVAADTATVYIGGHERWANNGFACGSAGTGAVDAPGMAGLSPATGRLTFNPTRGRGVGADDMLRTPAGLWIASDNGSGAEQCGGVDGHAGLCFLPN